ncbi:MAG: RrF2 family transcriptional regulator [Bauldia sp.]
MLSNRGKYGLKALAHMAGLGEGALVSGTDIATANAIPKKFLDAILNDLKRAGLVFARKGPGGGYRLARPAPEIMVGQAIRILDGALAPIACASRNFYDPCSDCGDVETCRVRLVMLQARDAMAAVLDQTSITDMRKLGHDQLVSAGLAPRRRRTRPARSLAKA